MVATTSSRVNYMSRKSCYGCTERNEDCHSTCPRYAEDVQENAKRRQQIEEAKRGEKEFLGYMKSRSRARDKKHSIAKSFLGKRGSSE